MSAKWRPFVSDPDLYKHPIIFLRSSGKLPGRAPSLDYVHCIIIPDQVFCKKNSIVTFLSFAWIYTLFYRGCMRTHLMHELSYFLMSQLRLMYCIVPLSSTFVFHPSTHLHPLSPNSRHGNFLLFVVSATLNKINLKLSFYYKFYSISRGLSSNGVWLNQHFAHRIGR